MEYDLVLQNMVETVSSEQTKGLFPPHSIFIGLYHVCVLGWGGEGRGGGCACYGYESVVVLARVCLVL